MSSNSFGALHPSFGPGSVGQYLDNPWLYPELIELSLASLMINAALAFGFSLAVNG